MSDLEDANKNILEQQSVNHKEINASCYKKNIDLDELKTAVEREQVDPNRLADKFGLNILAKLSLALAYPSDSLRAEILDIINLLMEHDASLFALTRGQPLISLEVLKQIQANIKTCLEKKLVVPDILAALTNVDCASLHQQLKANIESFKLDVKPIIVNCVESSITHQHAMLSILKQIIANESHPNTYCVQFFQQLKQKIETCNIDQFSVENARAALHVLEYLQQHLLTIGAGTEDKFKVIHEHFEKLDNVHIINWLAAFEASLGNSEDILLSLQGYCTQSSDEQIESFLKNNKASSLPGERVQLWTVLANADSILDLVNRVHVTGVTKNALDIVKEKYRVLSYGIKPCSIFYDSFVIVTNKIIAITRAVELQDSQQAILDQILGLVDLLVDLLKLGKSDIARDLIKIIDDTPVDSGFVSFISTVNALSLQIATNGDYQQVREIITNFETSLPIGGYQVNSSPVGMEKMKRAATVTEEIVTKKLDPAYSNPAEDVVLYLCQ